MIRSAGCLASSIRKTLKPPLAESMRVCYALFKTAPEKMPYRMTETVENDPGSWEGRRSHVFDQLDCLYRPGRGLSSRASPSSNRSRTVKGKTTSEPRFYRSRLQPDAIRISGAMRQHWRVENRPHGYMDGIFADDQRRARTGHAAQNLSVLKHLTLKLIRLDPVKRKGGIKARRLIAATSDTYRAQLLQLA